MQRSFTEEFLFFVPENGFERIVINILFKTLNPLLYNSDIHPVVKLNSGVPFFQETSNRIFLTLNNTDASLCRKCNVTLLVSVPNATIFEI